MFPKQNLRLSYLSVLCLSLLLLLFTYLSRLEPDQRLAHLKNNDKSRSEPFNRLIGEFFDRKTVEIGLVNIDEEESMALIEFPSVANVTTVHFDDASKSLLWEDLFPEWIDEDHRFNGPKCPTIPMPPFERYRSLDAVIARVPCGGDPRKGIRDVYRLQIHLVVANLVVGMGRRDVMVVFVGPCGPMWEIFRCEDLVKREGDIWVFRPDWRRLRQVLRMPIGSCELPLPSIKLGQEKIENGASRLQELVVHPRFAYATVLHSSEDYVCGAIALAQSIIRTNSTKDLVLLADGSITKKSRKALKMAGWKIKTIQRIRSPHAKKNAYNEWNYSKLRIWQLTEYDKILFIDSDLIVLDNLDRLFALPQLSAAANDLVLFNSGVMLIEPSKCVFQMLMDRMERYQSYNGGDQGYLNEVFTWWHRLPRRCNRLKLFKQNSHHTNGRDLSGADAIHFLGFKPWNCYRDYDCNWDEKNHRIFASDVAHRQWWAIHDSMPARLHRYCALSRSMESKLKRMRERARLAGLDDGHWKIKVKDPRQHHK